MSRRSLLLLFIPALSIAQAQERATIDSLLGLLRTVQPDTVKVDILTSLSWEYCYLDPDSGVKYGTAAVDLARQIGWEKGIGEARYLRASSFMNAMKLPEALDDYLAALDYAEQVRDSSMLSGVLSNIGGVYYYQGRNEHALEYYQRALDISQRIEPGGAYEVSILGNIGGIYYEKEDLGEALTVLFRAVSISESHGYLDQVVNFHTSIASIYIEMKDYSEAIAHAEKARIIAYRIDHQVALGLAHREHGHALMRIAEEKAMDKLPPRYNGDLTVALADSRSHLDSALAIFEPMNGSVHLAETYGILSQLEELKGNYRESLEYYKLFKETNDSLLSDEKSEKILETRMQYDFDKKEAAALAEQEKKDQRQRLVRNSIAGGLAGALLFLVVVWRQRNKISKARKRSDELLLNILPGEIAEELKAKGEAQARDIDNVSILFTDFKGFTAMSEQLTAQELVAEINTCFKSFDAIIGTHGVEKIKTIGDAYMAAGGLPLPSVDSARNTVLAAVEMQAFMKTYTAARVAQGKPAFEMRVGIHTGPVVAGIVGVKKFQYDIWGDTVNTASRMESSGEVGQVNISEATYELVKDEPGLTFTPRGKVQAKGKGEMEMYFVGRTLEPA